MAYTMGMTNETSAFDRLVTFFESQRSMAKALQVRPQSVAKWKKQIPADRVLEIERLTRGAVTRHEMRPDVFGSLPDEAA